MMKISTKGRYAMRVMIDLAENNTGSYIPLKDIAARQDISEKYLESIISLLNKSGLLEGARGKGGGYKLTKAPSEYTAASILTATEGGIAPVACLDTAKNTCPRAAECKTLPLWEGLYKSISDYLNGVTLEDLVLSDNPADNYVI